MTQLGYINAEGGPLLMMDASTSPLWKGIEGDGTDYQRACSIFNDDTAIEGSAISIGNTTGMLWEMKGPGTAFAFKNTHLVIIRAWLTDPTNNAALCELAKRPTADLSELGELTISTGVLVVLWATENGKCVQSLEIPPNGRPSGSLSVETAGLLLHIEKGIYRCVHDYVKSEFGQARRFHLLKKA